MQMPIESVLLKKRVRKNLGDLNALMESLKRYGLLNPVVVNRENELIAGHRRLEAARRLGWSTITVRVIDKADELSEIEMEIDENTQRKNLTTDELADAYLRLDKMRNPGLFRRIWNAIKRFFIRLRARK